jgi:hypothetical protein
VNRRVGRFTPHRLDGLNDRARRGRKPWLPQAAVQQMVEQAVNAAAPSGVQISTEAGPRPNLK